MDCLQIPDPNVAGNPKFKTGERLFRLTSSSSNQLNQNQKHSHQAFSSTGILRNYSRRNYCNKKCKN